MRGADHEATRDYSKGISDPKPRRPLADLLPRLLASVALAGALLCVVATFATVIQIRVGAVVKATSSGFDRHSVALVLIALFATAVTLAALRGSRPAMTAVAACGVVVLAISIVGDLPHLDDTGTIAQAYDDAHAAAGAGFYLETLAGALLLIAGGGLLTTTPLPHRSAHRPAREPREESA
jgi:hypothetical protein